MPRVNINALHNKMKLEFGVKRRQNCMPLSATLGGRDRLAKFLGENGFNRGAEVGVKKGEYSEILCSYNPNIELYCVDVWDKPIYHNKAIRRLEKYNAKLIQKYSLDAVNDFGDRSLDFVYIDANHTFDHIVCDIVFWSRKVKKYGIVACHDYFAHSFGGVMKAVDAYTHCHSINPWYVTLELWPTAFWVKNYK